MKSPDETKKGLECCAASSYKCEEDCPYRDECRKEQGGKAMNEDALALIQQLQAENAEKAEKIRVLESRNNALYHTILGVMHFVDKWLDVPAYDPDEDLNGTTAIGRASQAREITLQAIEQLEAERGAAVEDMESMADYVMDDVCEWCGNAKNCKAPCNFKWRGVQKEE